MTNFKMLFIFSLCLNYSINLFSMDRHVPGRPRPDQASSKQGTQVPRTQFRVVPVQPDQELQTVVIDPTNTAEQTPAILIQQILENIRSLGHSPNNDALKRSITSKLQRLINMLPTQQRTQFQDAQAGLLEILNLPPEHRQHALPLLLTNLQTQLNQISNNSHSQPQMAQNDDNNQAGNDGCCSSCNCADCCDGCSQLVSRCSTAFKNLFKSCGNCCGDCLDCCCDCSGGCHGGKCSDDCSIRWCVATVGILCFVGAFLFIYFCLIPSYSAHCSELSKGLRWSRDPSTACGIRFPGQDPAQIQKVADCVKCAFNNQYGLIGCSISGAFGLMTLGFLLLSSCWF